MIIQTGIMLITDILVTLLSSEEWWQTFVKSFVTSVETITGQQFDLMASGQHLEADELEALHHQIEDLEKEVSPNFPDHFICMRRTYWTRSSSAPTCRKS